ncbi:hypothetical protein LTR54_016205 [Friedmanniomyces endolithicus]|uniref:Uncharacterized protein n=1 Tax=Friedmanniomyces endolithicus TaxID=329885 RepID=A0AAN6JB24_9PEZI|nr:hypothetical protein LTS00_001636 [Friedmanniomyces endolithicus]KAK0315667.1 hypothetical protein LTR01_000967 [Friedmanniomyces endolithicus]KAK0317951.1 hypothetical protein LTR82_010941 [Friedmanniomyces endolithicus]KAK0836026.1 hypothetical protein LTR73_000527 [Friedmanniomyces endolithicus]KAK0977470.1 hypothetical protein LTR54_016205 [Friedmanniomyces endolithicus]
MLEIEPGASKTAALHAYHSMRHALLSLGYDKDCQELRDLAEAKDTLTDEEEREYYEEEYYIALCAQEDEECVLEDGEASSFSSDLAVLEANLHWRAATRFVSDDESEVDGDLEYASSEADEDTESDSGTDACNADDTDMDEGTDIDDLVDEVDAEPEEGSVDYVRYGCGYEAGSLRSPSLDPMGAKEQHASLPRSGTRTAADIPVRSSETKRLPERGTHGIAVIQCTGP